MDRPADPPGADGGAHRVGPVAYDRPYHELNFRASTALFGHLGVEWDLTEAEPRELDELSEWIALFKKHREMLLTGTVVGMDFPDETFTVERGGQQRPEQRDLLPHRPGPLRGGRCSAGYGSPD